MVDTNLIKRFVDVEEESKRQKMAMEELEQTMRHLSTAATGQAVNTTTASASAARPPPPIASPARPPPPPGVSAATAAAAARLVASLPDHPTQSSADSPQRQASLGPLAFGSAPLQPTYGHPRAEGRAAAHKSGMDSRRSTRVPPHDPAAHVEEPASASALD